MSSQEEPTHDSTLPDVLTDESSTKVEITLENKEQCPEIPSHPENKEQNPEIPSHSENKDEAPPVINRHGVKRRDHPTEEKMDQRSPKQLCHSHEETKDSPLFCPDTPSTYDDDEDGGNSTYPPQPSPLTIKLATALGTTPDELIDRLITLKHCITIERFKTRSNQLQIIKHACMPLPSGKSWTPKYAFRHFLLDVAIYHPKLLVLAADDDQHQAFLGQFSALHPKLNQLMHTFIWEKGDQALLDFINYWVFLFEGFFTDSLARLKNDNVPDHSIIIDGDNYFSQDLRLLRTKFSTALTKSKLPFSRVAEVRQSYFPYWGSILFSHPQCAPKYQEWRTYMKYPEETLFMFHELLL